MKKKENALYEKNQMIRVEITDMGTEGEGIGKIDGFPFFIKDTVIGDVVDAKVIKAKKNYAYARLEKVVTPSSFVTSAILAAALPDKLHCAKEYLLS